MGALASAGWVIPCLGLAAIASGALGVYIALVASPLDPHRGDLYRIMYIHVPATWMAILLYFVVALSAGGGALLGARFASTLAQATAPTGAMFAFMALWTGSMWSKPISGAWWVWDARLVADLVLLLLYVVAIGAYSALEDPRRADCSVAWISLAGAVIVLALLFAVALYPAIPGTPAHALPAVSSLRHWTVAGLCAVGACFGCYSAAVILKRVHVVALERRRESDWSAPPAAEQ